LEARLKWVLGVLYAQNLSVKKAVFRADPNKAGFITSFISPVNSKTPPRFTALDALWILSLFVGLIMTMRFLVAR
jgi:hypothetical protein